MEWMGPSLETHFLIPVRLLCSKVHNVAQMITSAAAALAKAEMIKGYSDGDKFLKGARV